MHFSVQNEVSTQKTELGKEILTTADSTLSNKSKFAISIFDEVKGTTKDGVDIKNEMVKRYKKLPEEKTDTNSGFINFIKNIFTKEIKDKDGNETGLTAADIAISTINPIYGVAKVIGKHINCES